MQITISSANPLVYILDNNKLTRTNYKDWLRNLKIIFSSKKLTHVLDQNALVLLAHPSSDQRVALEKWMDKDNRVKCYILASISNDFQQQHEDMRTAKEMLVHLQELYGE